MVTIGKSRHISKDIDSFRSRVLSKKKEFNKVHHVAKTKEKILAGLLNKLDELDACDSEEKDKDALDLKVKKCEELEEELKIELEARETLAHMVGRIKEQNISKTSPIVELRKKLSNLHFELESLEKEYLQTVSSITELNQHLHQESQIYEGLVNEKQLLVNEKSGVYSERLKLKISIDKEKDRNSIFEQQKRDKIKLKELEEKLNSYKTVELLEEEILSIENFCSKEEEKFKTIQKVTNVKYVGDILNHYEYLIENKQKLLDSVGNALIQIDSLNKEQVGLSQELSYLKYEAEDYKELETADLEKVREKLREKAKEIEFCELNIEKVQKIIIAALNAFSRIGEMLGISNGLGKIKIANLMDLVNSSYKELERIMELQSREKSSSSKSLNLSCSEANLITIKLK